MTIEKLHRLTGPVKVKKVSLTLSLLLAGKAEYEKEYLNALLKEVKSVEGIDTERINSFNVKQYTRTELCQLVDYLKAFAGLANSDFDAGTLEKLDKTQRIVKKRVLILDGLRSPYNIGAIFRSAESFEIERIILTEDSASPEHLRAIRTAAGTIDVIPYEVLPRENIVSMVKGGALGEVFALERGGKSIKDFSFPDKGAMILGNEEFGVSKALLAACENTVEIPTFGAKGSLNVSVATGIALAYWSLGSK